MLELKSMGLLAEGFRILNEGDHNLIPLDDDSHGRMDERFSSYQIVERNQDPPAPRTWIEHLPLFLKEDIIQRHLGEWPMAQEVYSDIIVFKIEDHLREYTTQVGMAKLAHSTGARAIFLDDGVEGEFRVRNLAPVAIRHQGRIHSMDDLEELDEETLARILQTRTRLKENGIQLTIDPAKAYYSLRLARERQMTVQRAKDLMNLLGRPLDVIDPYCGVGPAVAQLVAQNGLVSRLHATDLNPDAIELLELNLSNPSEEWYLGIADALTLTDQEELQSSFDLLLMNLPHDTLSHLPALLPLIRTDTPSMIRGWFVVEQEDIPYSERLFNDLLDSHGPLARRVTLEVRRQYNSTKVLTRFEALYGDWGADPSS